MEPGLSDQDDKPKSTDSASACTKPQWSLVFPTRMTAIPRSSTRRAGLAAMEPGLSDQDDELKLARDAVVEDAPQWSLVFPTRMTIHARDTADDNRAPQWRLVFPTRMT